MDSFSVSRNSIRRIKYIGRRVEKLSDFDKNWYPRVFRIVDYESAFKFSKISMTVPIWRKKN